MSRHVERCAQIFSGGGERETLRVGLGQPLGLTRGGKGKPKEWQTDDPDQSSRDHVGRVIRAVAEHIDKARHHEGDDRAA